MRYCNIYDPIQLGRTTIGHYFLIMQAIVLKQADKLKELHLQAWLNQQVKATKQQGKKYVPYFRTFDDFYKDPLKTSSQHHKKSRKNHEQLKQLVLEANRR